MQLRRTRAWFPCVDLPLAACPFDLHFTVPASHLAVSCGQLLKQAWTDNGKSRTFHYKLTIPTPPQGIALAAGELHHCYTLAVCHMCGIHAATCHCPDHPTVTIHITVPALPHVGASVWSMLIFSQCSSESITDSPCMLGSLICD